MLKEEIAIELKRLEDEEGRLTPEAVVHSAANPNSPLHGQFEWDAENAAHAWRLHQARRMIAAVRVVVHTEERKLTAYAYVRDPEVAPHEQGYRSTVRVATDEDMARSAVVAEFARAGAALKRARDMAAILGIAPQIEDMILRIETVNRKVNEDQPVS